MSQKLCKTFYKILYKNFSYRSNSIFTCIKISYIISLVINLAQNTTKNTIYTYKTKQKKEFLTNFAELQELTRKNKILSKN